jgi:23S rRNA (guanine745-N1)-methyltransferase
MEIKSFFKMACPIDLSPLQKNQSSYNCPQLHNFDVAKQGYMNLLPVHLKNSKHPGDSATMIKARTGFLETGLYDLILHRMYEKIMLFILNNDAMHFNIIDAGCGEGYYTVAIKKLLANSPSKKTFALFGYDISKEAILSASKRSRDITWAVATNKRIPICNQSSNIVVSAFGFPVFEEFRRVLEVGGMLLLVEPGPQHLLTLRNALYPVIKDNKEGKNEETIKKYLFLEDKHRYEETFGGLSGQNVRDLIYMTPHGFRTSAEKIKLMTDNPSHTIMIDVLMSSYVAI